MANTDSLKYSFSYGLGGGPLFARKFKKIMSSSGYELSSDPENVDIVIAHSAGISLIPQNLNPKIVIYVGMPLAIDKINKTQLAARRAIKSQETPTELRKTRTKAIFYFVSQPLRNIRIVKNVKAAKPVIFPHTTTIFIANQHDAWPKHKTLDELLEQQDWSFISLPGAHDDIWQNPERYVDIINHYAALLT